MSGAETARRRDVQRRIGGAESAAPKRRRRNGPPRILWPLNLVIARGDLSDVTLSEKKSTHIDCTISFFLNHLPGTGIEPR